ncbi:E3 ubiquitin-protein ligase RNF144A isoform X3 [Myotis myotis]|uniref:E3 ubiquitin-protein ligase RNF144A isoform X3 n=1 Tax=Myotis myotis TaxID=51298 RepID=UPI00174ADFD4|nr:E3 ubiquitin-protein ligase RNF144A isoform X3 [Myotis myotis]
MWPLCAKPQPRWPGLGRAHVPATDFLKGPGPSLHPVGPCVYCSAMTTAWYRPTWDLALDPLVSCKLCLGEYPVEQMTTLAQCRCVFCTLCLKQYVELLIKEGFETAISCPDATCPKQGRLQEHEIECMVAAEIMQRYKKLQFEREVLLDPCRTWCPVSTCQAVCQLPEMGLQTSQPVQCKACATEFCSACKASWHPGQGCPETMPITFLPGDTSFPATRVGPVTQPPCRLGDGPADYGIAVSCYFVCCVAGNSYMAGSSCCLGWTLPPDPGLQRAPLSREAPPWFATVPATPSCLPGPDAGGQVSFMTHRPLGCFQNEISPPPPSPSSVGQRCSRT